MTTIQPAGVEVYRSAFDHRVYGRPYGAAGQPLATLGLVGPFDSREECACAVYDRYGVPARTPGGAIISVGVAREAARFIVQVRRGRTWSTVAWCKTREEAIRRRDTHKRNDPYRGDTYRISED